MKEDIDVIADGLAIAFRSEPRKIALWLLTENPFFGGCSPAELIAARGESGMKKVAKFVVATAHAEQEIGE